MLSDKLALNRFIIGPYGVTFIPFPPSNWIANQNPPKD